MQLAPAAAARDKAVSFLGVEIPDDLWELAYQAAVRKLEYIVSHYGDLDGFRLGAAYLGKLAQEYLSARALSTFCAEKSAEKRPPPKRTAFTTPTVYQRLPPNVNQRSVSNEDQYPSH